MGYERRKFVNGLSDRSLEVMLNVLNTEKSRYTLDSEIAHGLRRLISQGYLQNPPYASRHNANRHRFHDAFICHSSCDKKFAQRVANDLMQHGFKVWFDAFEMLPGDSLYEKIQHGIKTSSWFLIVLSPNSVGSKWCKRELYNAMEEEFERDKVYVVPILYRKCNVPGFLKEKLWANFQGKKYKTSLHQLLKRLGKKS